MLSVDDLRWYREAKTILLDGCFDPIHPGHLAYLTDAVRLFPGHLVMVAVASDDDIRAKGREPLFDQRTRAKVLEGLKAVDLVVLKDRPMEQILGKLKPQVYIKGNEWEGKLPPEQVAACSLYDIHVVYMDTARDSSTARLRSWALREADASCDRLEAFCSKQTPASVPWKPVTDYSFEARKAIEGPHAELIREAFQPEQVVDAGCGPGHLVRMLREWGIPAYGLDLHPPDADFCYYGNLCSDRLDTWLYRSDLVINRECLEHLTVTDIGKAVRNLFRLSSKYVYITTRFSQAGVFDAATEFDVDPTHITCLSQPFLRSLCVLNGGMRRRDLERKLDWQKKGRVLVYEVTQ